MVRKRHCNLPEALANVFALQPEPGVPHLAHWGWGLRVRPVRTHSSYATDRPPRLKKLPEVLIIIFPRNYEILTNRHKIEISTKHQIARVDSGETITRQEYSVLKSLNILVKYLTGT
jgi:hypothetical protein